jgi:hypothetical protein
MGVGDQRHAPAALPPGERLGTHCIGDWVGPQGPGWTGAEKLTSPPPRNSIPGPYSTQQDTILTELSL